MPFDAFVYQPVHPDIEIMRAARDIVDRGGAKGCYTTTHKGNDRYCAVAAISTAAGAGTGRGFLPAATKRLIRELGSELPRTGSRAIWRLQGAKGRVIIFNDHHKTTQRQVLNAFDQTIARMEHEVALT